MIVRRLDLICKVKDRINMLMHWEILYANLDDTFLKNGSNPRSVIFKHDNDLEI